MANRERPAAAVADSWARVEAWLDAHLPAYKSTLRPGVSADDLTKFEMGIGRPLPDDVRASWLIHDGQQSLPLAVVDALNEEYGVRMTRTRTSSTRRSSGWCSGAGCSAC